MTDTSHPCYGLVCQDCLVCKFDVDLFKDGVLPNEKKKEKSKNMKEICNYCGHLIKRTIGETGNFFNACCGKEYIQSGTISRPRVIEYHTYPMADIEKPEWCPYNKGARDTVFPLLPKPSEEVKGEEEVKDKEFKDLTWSEKREYLKTLPKMVKWEDIKIDHYYVVPKIMSTPKKIVHVEDKSDTVLRCHEVSEYSGTEFSTVTNIYPNDIEAVFLVEIHDY